MKNTRYNEKVERTYLVFNSLKAKYKVDICKFDHTAIAVSDITDKQHSDLCRELHCSGTYNEKTKIGIILNFGKYK